MYGKLKNSDMITEIKLPDSDLSTSKEFYASFKSSIFNARSFNIWSFEQIGLFDPFPEEPMETNFLVPETEEDLVYRPNRYVEGESPNLLYFPSKLVLF